MKDKMQLTAQKSFHFAKTIENTKIPCHYGKSVSLKAPEKNNPITNSTRINTEPLQFFSHRRKRYKPIRVRKSYNITKS